MQTFMRIIGLGLATAMVATTAAGAVAQDRSPEPTVVASPAPIVPPIPQTVEAVAEPLPVADYWVEWKDHKQASHERANRTIRDAKASRSKTAQWYRALVGVHADELQWLANHQPMACYRAEHEQWSGAVEDLHAIHQKALRFVRAGNASGLRRIDKQRREAMKRLNGALANVATCDPPESVATDATTATDPLVGRWKTVQRFVNQDGGNVTHQATTKIARDGRFLLRVKRDDFCRQRGFGSRPLTASGQGEFLTDDGLRLTWAGATLRCHPRLGPPKLVLESGPPDVPWRYDEAHDVLIGVQGPANCSWRAKGGSPKDCTAFWRGTPAPMEDVEVVVEESATSNEEATASPGADEG